MCSAVGRANVISGVTNLPQSEKQFAFTIKQRTINSKFVT